MFQVFKIVLVGAALLAGSGCAGLKEFTAKFEKQWSDPDLFEDTLKDKTPELAKADKNSLAMVEAGIIENDDCATASTNARRALTLTPNSEWPRVVLAECDLTAGKAREALAVFEQLEKLSAEPRVLIGMGVANIHLGHYERAIEGFHAALLTDGTRWRGWNGLGVAYDMSEKWEQAAQAFLTSAEVNPEKGAPLNNLGMSYLQQDKIPEAIAAFHSALKREPALAPARLNLRIAYAMSGDYDKAVAGASNEERAAVYNNAGVAAMRRGENNRARSLFQKALETSPVFYALAYDNLERLPQK